jgi:hypothetical protein
MSATIIPFPRQPKPTDPEVDPLRAIIFGAGASYAARREMEIAKRMAEHKRQDRGAAISAGMKRAATRRKAASSPAPVSKKAQALLDAMDRLAQKKRAEPKATNLQHEMDGIAELVALRARVKLADGIERGDFADVERILAANPEARKHVYQVCERLAAAMNSPGAS